jgi:hypothetical protein
MKAYGSGCIHIFLTSALVGGEWSPSRPGRFTPGERAPGTHCIGGWVDLRSGPDDLEKRKFLTTGTRTPTPRSSSPLYRLRYPGSQARGQLYLNICTNTVRNSGLYTSIFTCVELRLLYNPTQKKLPGF